MAAALMSFVCLNCKSQKATVVIEDDTISANLLKRNLSGVLFYGVAQKGPLQAKSPVKIHLLDQSLEINKVLFTEIIDIQGHYEYKEDLDGELLEVHAQGTYFNELTGGISPNFVTLMGLQHAKFETPFNINVITTLIIKRVKYLYNNGSTIEEATSQAQHELMSVFPFADSVEIPPAHLMDLSYKGLGSEVLLLTSAILEYLSFGEPMDALLEKIALDLEEDGTIDDAWFLKTIKVAVQNIDLDVLVRNMIIYNKQFSQDHLEIPNLRKFLDI